MRVLVTGASGMLGHALVPVLRAAGHDLTAVDVDVDVTDAQAVERCFAAVGPQAVFHLAAWTDVDAAEGREADAMAVNAEGCRAVARSAAAWSADLVVVSTDYVFPGDRPDGYGEDDPVGPCNVYGRTKLAGEIAARGEHPAGTRIARTAWLYGAGGRNFVDAMRRASAEREQVRVVDDQHGSPTWTRELVPALVSLLGHPPGVYHTACAGQVSWAGLARAVFAEIGSACEVVPIATAELGRPAPRPTHSALRSTRPGAPRLRPWRDALHDYLREDAHV